MVKDMSRRIVVTSGKGGVGKTSVAANLGAKLSRAGHRVCLCDLDIGLNNLDVVCGIENRIVYDLIDVIEGRCRLSQALVEVDHYPNLCVLPSAHLQDKSGITGQNVRAVTDKLAAMCDFVIIDCPAGIEQGFHRAVSAAGEAVVVTTPHISSVRDADRVTSLLRCYALAGVYLVVNRARGDLMMSGDMMSPEEIADILKLPLLGVIPEDDDLPLSTAGGSMVSYGRAPDLAFNTLADNLTDNTGEVFDCTARYRGFFGAVKRSLKRKI